MLTDEIKSAMSDPNVVAARTRLRELINEFEGGGIGAASNYIDQCVVHSLGTRGVQLTIGDVDRVEAAYAAFCDALAPFQPSKESVRASFDTPWAGEMPTEGQIFYFVPSSGGYWVAGKAEMSHLLGKVRTALNFAGLLRGASTSTQ